MDDLEKVMREGEVLAPGVYAYQGELHLDLEAFVIASGGDPTDEQDVHKAIEKVIEIAEERGIEVEIGEK